MPLLLRRRRATVRDARPSGGAPHDADGELPYGWELAVDDDGVVYFIDHNTQTTTREDPRRNMLLRKAERQQQQQQRKGAATKMRLGDEDGEEDKEDDEETAIDDDGTPTVISGPSDGGDEPVGGAAPGPRSVAAKVAAFSAGRPGAVAGRAVVTSPGSAKRPSSMYAAVGTGAAHGEDTDPDDPSLNKILKIFLESGDMRSLRYGIHTTAADMVRWVARKMNIRCPEHFALYMEESDGRVGKWLKPTQRLVEAEAMWPLGVGWSYRFRVRYVPRAPHDMLDKDPVAFDYWYSQVVADVTERAMYAKLSARVIKQLAGLHCQVILQRQQRKFDLDYIEHSIGFDHLFPSYVIEANRPKDMRKTLQSAWRSCRKLGVRDCQLMYLSLVADLPEFGGRNYRVRIDAGEHKFPCRVMVSPQSGLSRISEQGQLVPIVGFSQLAGLEVNDMGSRRASLLLTLRDAAGGGVRAAHAVPRPDAAPGGRLRRGRRCSD